MEYLLVATHARYLDRRKASVIRSNLKGEVKVVEEVEKILQVLVV